jgi:hypothetical protein
MKALIVVVLIAIVVVLGSAGVAMLRRPRDGHARDSRDARMARALALRVVLSIALFAFILLAWWLGWIHPTGLPVSR